MITNGDIELMHEWRDEIITNRRRPVTLQYFEKVFDDITGELIEEKEVSREVKSVVTELSSATGAGADRYMENGIKYEKGDIWFSVKIELIDDIADRLERVIHDGKEYEILAIDKKGIGIRNRFELLGRLVS